VDNQDRGVEVCIDLRQDSPTRNRLFEGGRHPRKSGATLIELGSEQEGIIIPLLSRYLDSDEARKQLTEYGFELFQDALIRYGDVDATVLGTDAAND
jgi:hypothetical protein